VRALALLALLALLASRCPGEVPGEQVPAPPERVLVVSLRGGQLVLADHLPAGARELWREPAAEPTPGGYHPPHRWELPEPRWCPRGRY
jgi:hypothetical protein